MFYVVWFLIFLLGECMLRRSRAQARCQPRRRQRLPLGPTAAAAQGLLPRAYLFAGTFNLERYGVRYDCNQAALLRAFNYSLLGVFAISALLQFTVAGAGLRGERSGRRWSWDGGICRCCSCAVHRHFAHNERCAGIDA